ncbi:MAG: T9SS type A sorting domain-containing protein, partial [Bacteroidales bacterium]|nr:T9SS type A sorting domain-containing protein [Bacteroidales bacterium]
IVQLPDTSYRSAGFFNDSLYGGSNHLCVTNCAKTGYWDASLGGAIIGGNKNDKANHLLVTLDSGFLATGTSESYGDALSSLFIVKSGPLVETVIWSGHIHTFIEQFPEKITQQISVYPNPAVNYCVIRHPVVKNNASVVLFGIDGALLMTVPVVNGSKKTTINISNLAKGVYFARFFDGSNYASPAVKKIVKH